MKATTPTHARTARVASIVRSLSLRIRVCHPNTRLHVRLLGPCFKTGRSRPNHGDHCALLLSSAAHCNPKVTSRMPSLLQPHSAIPTQNTSTGLPHRAHPSMHPALSRDRFPFNNFTCYLTPFSRCFSSFPHGTCSLSVSCPYLAFDGIYHPFELHSQATRLVDTPVFMFHGPRRDCHPLWCSIPGDLCPLPTLPPCLELTTRSTPCLDSKFELFPLHSPLLRESLLVSFPPLTDMLKFSG